MSENRFSSLRDFLTSHYEDLKKRLAYRLGSVDRASDALHDTYLRLQDKEGGASAPDAATVAHPAAYLYQMAFHLAVDRERSAEGRLTSQEADELLAIADPTPGPAQIAEGRQDLQRLLQDMDRLPRRQREILLAVRLDGATREQLATRYRISLRTVDRELEKAYAFCQAQLEEGRRWRGK